MNSEQVLDRNAPVEGTTTYESQADLETYQLTVLAEG
jgi:hypothetical protein